MAFLEKHKEIYKALNKNRVKYLVIGGVAAMAHGVPRFTLDLDILIEPTLESCQKALKALKEAGLKRAKESNAEVLLAATIHTIIDEVTVDLHCGARSSDFNEMWQRRSIKHLEDVEVSIISIEDLIETKKHTDRPRDKEDVEILEKIMRGEIE